MSATPDKLKVITLYEQRICGNCKMFRGVGFDEGKRATIGKCGLSRLKLPETQKSCWFFRGVRD